MEMVAKVELDREIGLLAVETVDEALKEALPDMQCYHGAWSLHEHCFYVYPKVGKRSLLGASRSAMVESVLKAWVMGAGCPCPKITWVWI